MEFAQENPTRIPEGSDLRVIGIGQSAGCLDSLLEFFSRLPSDPGMGFEFVHYLQCLSPGTTHGSFDGSFDAGDRSMAFVSTGNWNNRAFESIGVYNFAGAGGSRRKLPQNDVGRLFLPPSPPVRGKRGSLLRTYEALLDSAAEAIVAVDLDGVCTFSNSTCGRMLGYESPDEVVGARIHSIVHPDCRGGDRACPIERAIAKGEEYDVDDGVFHRRDGGSFSAECRCRPIRDDGILVGAALTFFDVTPQKDAENELRLAAERREQFLAMLSHETRNPLAAILNAVRSIRMKGIDDGVEPTFAVIERQARHMARLLDDLHDVARITRGEIRLRRERTDIRLAVTAALEATRSLIEDSRATIRTVLPRNAVMVSGDPDRLQQVVVNLVVNAIKFSDPNPEVDVSVGIRGSECVLSVKDRGRGISPGDLPAIFDLFVHTDQGHDRSDGGFGVGLTLIRTIVTMHGGVVEARSDGPGEGSEFVVRLPLSEVVSPNAPTTLKPENR